MAYDIVVPDVSKIYHANARVFGTYPPIDGNAKLKLYQNDYVPTAATLLSNFTASACPGISQYPLSGGYNVGIVGGDVDLVAWPAIYPTAGAGSGYPYTVYGYFVVDSTTGALLWCQRFETSWQWWEAGDVMILLPVFGACQCSSDPFVLPPDLGYGVATMGPMTGVGAGVFETDAGYGTVTVGPMTGRGAGVRSFTGYGTGSMGPMTGSGAGVRGFLGSGSGSMGPMTGSGAGIRSFLGSGSVTMEPMAGAGVGTFTGAFTGSGGGSMGPMTGAGVGVFTGGGPSPSISGFGTIGQGGTTATSGSVAVTTGQAIFVCVNSTKDNGGDLKYEPTVTIIDTIGNTYTAATTSLASNAGSPSAGIQWFVCASSIGSSPLNIVTVTRTIGLPGIVMVGQVVVDNFTAVDNFSGNTDAFDSPIASPVTVGGSLILTAYGSLGTVSSSSPGSPFTGMAFGTNGNGLTLSSAQATSSLAIGCTWTTSPGPNFWAAQAVSIR